MSEPGHFPTPTPANDDRDPFLQADTALGELYRIRRDILAIPPDRYSFQKWQERQRVLRQLGDAIEVCLRKS